MSLIKPKALAVLDYSMVNGFLEPNESFATPFIDRTLTPTFAEFVSVQMQGQWEGTVVSPGKAYVYVVAHTGGLTISDSEVEFNTVNRILGGVTNFYLNKIGAILVGELNFNDPVATNLSRGCRFNAAKAFGGVIPTQFSVVVENKSGMQLRNPGGPIISVQGFQAETV